MQETLDPEGVRAKDKVIISSTSFIFQTREQCKLWSAVLSRQAITSSESFQKYEYFITKKRNSKLQVSYVIILINKYSLFLISGLLDQFQLTNVTVKF